METERVGKRVGTGTYGSDRITAKVTGGRCLGR
jgi:hypothetical protein